MKAARTVWDGGKVEKLTYRHKRNIKAFYAQVEENNKEGAQEAYNLAAKRLDQAAAKKVIHKNKAARKKSQLARALNSI